MKKLVVEFLSKFQGRGIKIACELDSRCQTTDFLQYFKGSCLVSDVIKTHR